MAVTNTELIRLGYLGWCCNQCAEKAFYDNLCPYCQKECDGMDALFVHKNSCSKRKAI